MSVARLVLAAIAILRIHLPTPGYETTPTDHAVAAILYLSYALVLAMRTWRTPVVRRGVVIGTHVIDLALFGFVLIQPEALSGLFLLCFTFAVVAGLLRWQWAGAAWTAGWGFAAYALSGVYAAFAPEAPGLQAEVWVGRGLTIAATAAFLAILAARESRERAALVRIAGWSRLPPRDELPALLADNLRNAAELLGSERLIIAYEDADEPFFSVAEWRDGAIRTSWEPPATFLPLVADDLVDEDFLCYGAEGTDPHVLLPSVDNLRTRPGPPFHPAFAGALRLHDALAVRVKGELVAGRLLATFGRRMTADDIRAGRRVAREIAASLDRFYHQRRSRESAAEEERSRVLRELHDGVLQSLGAAALRLKTAELALTYDPATAGGPLQEAQQLLTEGQRELRFWVEEQKPRFLGTPERSEDLLERLQSLARHVEQVWGLRVTLEAGDIRPAPAHRVIHGLHRIAQEALVNSARHGHASAATLRVTADGGMARLVLEDNGRGFRFHGRVEHDTLARERLGPVVLKARVAELGGRLAIDSSDAGARLEISVPLGGAGA